MTYHQVALRSQEEEKRKLKLTHVHQDNVCGLCGRGVEVAGHAGEQSPMEPVRYIQCKTFGGVVTQVLAQWDNLPFL